MYLHGAPATENSSGWLQEVAAKNAMWYHLVCADRKGLCRMKSNNCVLFQEIDPLVFGIGVFILFINFCEKARLWTGCSNIFLEKDSPNLISGAAGLKRNHQYHNNVFSDHIMWRKPVTSSQRRPVKETSKLASTTHFCFVFPFGF